MKNQAVLLVASIAAALVPFAAFAQQSTPPAAEVFQPALVLEQDQKIKVDGLSIDGPINLMLHDPSMLAMEALTLINSVTPNSGRYRLADVSPELVSTIGVVYHKAIEGLSAGRTDLKIVLLLRVPEGSVAATASPQG